MKNNILECFVGNVEWIYDIDRWGFNEKCAIVARVNGQLQGVELETDYAHQVFGSYSVEKNFPYVRVTPIERETLLEILYFWSKDLLSLDEQKEFEIFAENRQKERDRKQKEFENSKRRARLLEYEKLKKEFEKNE